MTATGHSIYRLIRFLFVFNVSGQLTAGLEVSMAHTDPEGEVTDYQQVTDWYSRAFLLQRTTMQAIAGQAIDIPVAGTNITTLRDYGIRF